MPLDAEKEIEYLRNQILDHDYRYYTLAQPVISDEEYDLLMHRLFSLEQQHPDLLTPDSPSQRVGGRPLKEFSTVTHIIPMLSLANTYNEEDIRAFDRRIAETLGIGAYRYVCELKFDGVAVTLHYHRGILTLGATRGDGMQGDDISQNLKTIRSIPLRLHAQSSVPDFCEVRGEIFMKRSDFEHMNEERLLSGEKTFMNPRNSTAGTLKLQDPKLVAQRPLNFFAYYLRCPGIDLQSHSRCLAVLEEYGLPVNKQSKICTTIDEVIAYWKTWEQNRDTLPFDIDGIVVKLDALAQQEQLGSIAKSPRWAAAFKFSSRQAETILHEIHLQIGRLGTVTPVADLEPVFLGGTTVTHATLHNAEYIKKLDIRLTDHVIVEKGGDVIPKVSSVVLEKRRKGTQTFGFPDSCPECGAKLFRPEGEANYFCENSECPAQIMGRIQHFASRGAMDIEGLGEANIEQLVLCGLLKNSADIYDLKKNRDILLAQERWGQKSVQKLLDAVEKSRKQKFHRVLYALGIRHVGASIAQRIVEKFRTIQQLESACVDELKELEGIGPQIAESVVRFFADVHNRTIVRRLKSARLTMAENEKPKAASGSLSGKVFVLTGTLTTMTRDEAKEHIESSGGKVSSLVSTKTDFVVVGADAGSKLKKARLLKIPLIDEKNFIKLITK